MSIGCRVSMASMTSTRWVRTARRAVTARIATLQTGRRKRGFTLMELLIVLAIMGLISTLAVSGIARSMPGLALRNDARLVADALRAARTAAVGNNREVTLVLDVEQHTVTFDGRRSVRLD